jgi:Jagunal, ER re-organisation during oogenesis
VLSFIGLSAARSNKVINMQKYMAGVIVFGLFPVLYCIIHYMNDVIAYMKLEDTELEDAENIMVWQVSFGCGARCAII